MSQREPTDSYMKRGRSWKYRLSDAHYESYASSARVLCVAGDGVEFACHADILSFHSEVTHANQQGQLRRRWLMLFDAVVGAR